MLLRVARHFTFLFALALALPGCSADSVVPPEPTVERPGSFVALTDSDGVIFLVRTLRVIPLDVQPIYEAILYSGEPSSYDEAREWAKDPDWPVARPYSAYPFDTILTLQPEVVWFRTLTQNERDAVRQ
jgi:hypothetical protein